MEKTEKKTPFSPDNNASDSSVSSGGNKEGERMAGWETAVTRGPDSVNGRWNTGVMEQKRKEFVDGVDHNKS